MWQYITALSALLSLFASTLVLYTKLTTVSSSETTTHVESRTRPVLLPSSTFHSRFKPLLHSFRYPVLYIGIDLDTVGYVDALFSFSAKVWRPLSLRSEDYLGVKHQGSIKQRLWKHMQDHHVDVADLRKSFLITTPRLFGYSFNPVSFHYVYDTNDDLAVVVLEVNNTFGEKHIYVLQQDKASDRLRDGYTTAQTFPRRFHVSPFNDRSGSYQLQCLDPFDGSSVKVGMHLTLIDPEGTKKLIAQVNSICAPVPTTNLSSAIWTLCKYGTAVFLTVPRILIQAWKLHYSKKLGVYLRPEPFEETSAIGRQAPTATDLFFKDLVVDYISSNTEWNNCKSITFDIIPASSHERSITIAGNGKRSGELVVTVLSYTFFSSLVTSVSALHCLWTDSLALESPIFRVSDEALFLDVFAGSGFTRHLDGRHYHAHARMKFRGPPQTTVTSSSSSSSPSSSPTSSTTFSSSSSASRPPSNPLPSASTSTPLPTDRFIELLHALDDQTYLTHQYATNNGIDNFAHEAATRPAKLSSSSSSSSSWSWSSVWRYRWEVWKTLVVTWTGNTAFGSIATFMGPSGRPADEWVRVERALRSRIRAQTAPTSTSTNTSTNTNTSTRRAD